MTEAPETRSVSSKRLAALLEQLGEMAALAERATPLPVSDAHDELDAIAYAFNVLLGELRFASEARVALETERLAQAEATADAEQRRAEQLRIAKDAADEANRAKTAFLRTISHELRTPVTVLIGSAELLARKQIDDAERIVLAERFLRGSRQLLGLLDNVLDIARIEAGRLDPRSTSFLPALLLDDVRQTFAGAAAQKGLGLTVSGAGDLPEVVSDPQLLRQVLVNLVSNALKYTVRGEIGMRASLAETPAGLVLRVHVSDTGAGIAEHERDRLFVPFGRTASSSGTDGTGLGLHLSARIAEALGGTLGLAWSAPGEGSRFDLEVPVTLSKPAAPAPKPAAGSPALAGLRVLIADDNADILELFTQLLEGEGAQVTKAADGAAALHLALAGDHDVVLMDAHMPVMNGLEAARRLRGEGYAKPLLALTADVASDHRARCLAAGYTSFIAKPVDYDALVAAIRAAAGR